MDDKPGGSPRPRSTLLQSQVTGFSMAVEYWKAGRIAEAQTIYRQVLGANPGHYYSLHHLGLIEQQLGQSERAVDLIRHCLAIKSDYAEAWADLGANLTALGRNSEALAACEQAINLDPKLAPAYGHLGNVLLKMGRCEDAVIAYLRAVKLDPKYAMAFACLADALVANNRLDEALMACDKALALDPQLAVAHAVKGLILHRRGRFAEAKAAYVQALQINPRLALVHTRLANTLRTEGRFDAAINANKRAIDIDPTCGEAYYNLAVTLQALGRNDEALAAYRQSITMRPENMEAHANLGTLLHRIGHYEDAVATFQSAISLDASGDFALPNLLNIFRQLGRLDEASECYRQLIAIKGTSAAALLYDYCSLRREICDWQGLEADETQAIAALRTGGERVPPFAALGMQCTPADQLALARAWAHGFSLGAKPQAAPSIAVNPAGRIRIGYLSSDFFNHATARMIAGLIEHHDRNRFEIFAYSWAHDDGSDVRQRLTGAFDSFADIRQFSHAETVRRIREDGIDILIDVKGYTRDARTVVMANHPAPVQVNFLGYPATMGAPFIDYIIADPFVLPMDQQQHFDEKIIHMPACFQPNDGRSLTSVELTRQQCGLPDNAFVFCSFNGIYKITRPVFNTWMKLLAKVPGSVLWLLNTNATAKTNMQREAGTLGVDASRLIFAPPMPIDGHLARYKLADLFLDTLPVNAHATASEALGSGLPVITCVGNTFAGRVAGSLLKAAGLPDLVTNSLDDYSALALLLATDEREKLRGWREKLESGRNSAPLFQAERYARDIEAAYAHMIWLYASGRKPELFAVADLPAANDTRRTAGSA